MSRQTPKSATSQRQAKLATTLGKGKGKTPEMTKILSNRKHELLKNKENEPMQMKLPKRKAESRNLEMKVLPSRETCAAANPIINIRKNSKTEPQRRSVGQPAGSEVRNRSDKS